MAVVNFKGQVLPRVDLTGVLPRRLEVKKEIIASFSSERLFLYSFIFCIASILVQVFLILASRSKLPPQLPLFYSRPWGEAMLASPVALWIIPGMATIFIFLNFIIAVSLSDDKRFLARALIVTSLVIAVACAYNLTKIVSLLT